MALAQSDIEALTIIVQTAFKEMAKSMGAQKEGKRESQFPLTMVFRMRKSHNRTWRGTQRRR
jgi:hypothetical protein